MLDIPEVIMSPLCQTIERDGHTVEVHIYQTDERKWILETVDIYQGDCTNR